MTSQAYPMRAPDIKIMRDHLDLLFAPALEDNLKFQIQIDAGNPNSPWTSQQFEGSDLGIEEACVFAERMNVELQRNIYVGVNPRRSSLPVGTSAKDTDILCAYWQFADVDKPETVTALRKEVEAGTFPLQTNLTVLTGRTPEARPHFYWRLEEACENLGAWTQNQRNIAARLGGDSVIDPRRIMRLSGSINYPGEAKVKRGYRVELVTHVVPDDRPPVPFEQFLISFPQVAINSPHSASPASDRPQLGTDRITPAVLIERALNDDGAWHNSVRDLVAHWANLGWSDAEIMLQAAGLTTSGYTVQQTREEMRRLIDSARVKWGLPDTQVDVEAAKEEAESVFETFSIAEAERMPPPTYLVDQIITDYGLTVLYGDPGAGKSFLAIDMAGHIACGMDWNGHKVEQGGVLYIVAEGGRGIGKRLKGWRQHHKVDASALQFQILPQAVQLLDDAQCDKLARTIHALNARTPGGIKLVVIDTVSRSMAGADENTQDTMSAFVAAMERIQRVSGLAVMAVHHSGKNKESGPRGSTVLPGACDTIIGLKGNAKEQWATMQIEKQKDDETGPDKLFKKEQIALRHEQTGIEQGTTIIMKMATGNEAKGKDLTRLNIKEIFDTVQLGWVQGNPW